jgi:hypothetical protein
VIDLLAFTLRVKTFRTAMQFQQRVKKISGRLRLRKRPLFNLMGVNR